MARRQTSAHTSKAHPTTLADTSKAPKAPPQAVMPRPKLMMSQEEAADELGIGLTFFRAQARAGYIPVVSVGRRQMVPYAALVAYVRRLCREQGVALDDMALAG